MPTSGGKVGITKIPLLYPSLFE